MLLILVGAVTAVAGCRKSDSDAAGDTVVSYLRAFGAGDGQEACDRLTPDTRRLIAPRVAQKLGGRDCPDAIRALWGRLPAQQADALRKATATRVKVRGEAAEVRFRAGRARGIAKLRKGADGWRISLLPRAR